MLQWLQLVLQRQLMPSGVRNANKFHFILYFARFALSLQGDEEFGTYIRPFADVGLLHFGGRPQPHGCPA
jgi:hypothetical protein